MITSGHFLFAVGALCSLAVAACAPVTGTKQGDGALIGATLGATAGSLLTSRLGIGGQLAGELGGTLVGTLVGAQIGAYLDEEDQKALLVMTEETAASGQQRTYRNPKTGVHLVTKRKTVSRVAASPPQVAQSCSSLEQIVTLEDGTSKTDVVYPCRAANGSRKIT